MPEIQPSPLFLMSLMALQVGMGSGTNPHRHTAAQIILAMDLPLKVRMPPASCWLECAAVLIPPNVTHHVASLASPSLMIWLDPATPEARAIRACSPQMTLISESEYVKHRAALTQLASHVQTRSDAQHLLAGVTQALLPEIQAMHALDERIVSVLKTMRQPDWLNQSYPLTALAQTVNLSTGRLRHLFCQELGVSLQRYWVGYRLLVAIRRLGKGVSLTELAHDAGFADLAHFSRAFQASFGLSPSLAAEDSRLIQVLNCED